MCQHTTSEYILTHRSPRDSHNVLAHIKKHSAMILKVCQNTNNPNTPLIRLILHTSHHKWTWCAKPQPQRYLCDVDSERHRIYLRIFHFWALSVHAELTQIKCKTILLVVDHFGRVFLVLIFSKTGGLTYFLLVLMVSLFCLYFCFSETKPVRQTFIMFSFWKGCHD